MIKSKIYKEDFAYDYPRIPFTENESVFNTLADLGDRLINLHLLKSTSKTNHGYPIEGEHLVSKPKLENNRLYINDTQYFDNVSDEVFSYSIGGYQVIMKYLKSREVLSSDDILHIQKIIAVIAETILIQNDIDDVYSKLDKIKA